MVSECVKICLMKILRRVLVVVSEGVQVSGGSDQNLKRKAGERPSYC